jgi:hypothetical protein
MQRSARLSVALAGWLMQLASFYAHNLRGVGVLAIFFLSSGCRPEPAVQLSERDSRALLAPKADTGLALRAVVLRDSINADDSEPMEVVYAIINGPSPAPFDNHPGRFRVQVTGPDGLPAVSLGGSGPGLGVMGQTDLVLPAGGSLVQRQDLRCISDAAYSSIRHVPSANTCLAMYALALPGAYKVVVDYFGPAEWHDLDSMTASVNRGDSKVGPEVPTKPGLHLTDTVGFWVR